MAVTYINFRKIKATAWAEKKLLSLTGSSSPETFLEKEGNRKNLKNQNTQQKKTVHSAPVAIDSFH